MHTPELVQAAHRVLNSLTGTKKVWMTARAIAARIRSDNRVHSVLGCSGPSQIELRDALIEHARQRPRVIRNSASPSAKTLEVLWGSIEKVGEAEVPSPILHLPPDSLPRLLENLVGLDEIEEHKPDFFLSYRHEDSADAEKVVDMVEAKGHSVWMSGTRIAEGEFINEQIIRAMEETKKMLLYLSWNALGSLWVAKEHLVGRALSRPRVIVLKGDDRALVQWVRETAALNGDARKYALPRGPDTASYSVASQFYGLLEADLRDPNTTLYVYGGDVAAQSTDRGRAQIVSLTEFSALR